MHSERTSILDQHSFPGGTVTRTVLDVRDNPLSIWRGTIDESAIDTDPTGGGAGCNNMVVITEDQFDGGADRGDNNLTELTQHVDYTTARVTALLYDWRNRRTATDGEIDFYQKDDYDNRDLLIKTERYNTTADGNLIARGETLYDNRGRIYRTIRYGVDPATGQVGNSLRDNTWYDAASNICKSQPSGSELFTKPVFDGVGRQIASYLAFDRNEIFCPAPGDVTNATVLEQTETLYDDASNAIETITRLRYHNATGTGPLGNPASDQPKARVTYRGNWPDPIGRQIATADYGTNGGTPLARPDEIPERSDTCLVTSITYSGAGDQETITDPAAMVTRMGYDDAGREISKILNDSGSSVGGLCTASDDVDVTVLTSYTADGNIWIVTAVNTATGNQQTAYLHGTSLLDSSVATSNLKFAEVYPDSVDASDRITFAYNRQGEIVKTTDQNGTVHVYSFDLLGRKTADRVTVLGPDVDGSVRCIGTTYEVRGMVETVTSYDRPSAGAIVNQVRMAYNEFGQLATEHQNHIGAVDDATPFVGYGYANGANNTIRPTNMKYPNGRMKYLNYGPAEETNDMASRVGAIGDDHDSEIVRYEYLGKSFFVETKYSEPGIRNTLVGTEGGDDPDTGDIYRGLDRFSRVKDLMWQKVNACGLKPISQMQYRNANIWDLGDTSVNFDLANLRFGVDLADVERVKYSFDRVGNRTMRQNTVDPTYSHDEAYTYDGIQRLKDFQRGTLTDGDIESRTFAQCWTLDATGNWSGFREDNDGDDTWDLIQTRISNPANEIAVITNSVGPPWTDPAYSPTGNMTTIPQSANPSASYAGAYDAWDRLVGLSADDAPVMRCTYDGFKRRTVRQTYVAGELTETRHFFYTTDWQAIEERVGAATVPDRQYNFGQRYVDDLVLRDRRTAAANDLDERLYPLQDANWNVTAIVSEGGIVCERFGQSPYGVPAVLTAAFNSLPSSQFDWNVLFSGYHFETGVGLYVVRNRWLSPLTGCWLQRDPLGLSAGFNLYNYVSNQPISMTDPSGLGQFTFYYYCFFGVLWDMTQCWGACVCTSPLCSDFRISILGWPFIGPCCKWSCGYAYLRGLHTQPGSMTACLQQQLRVILGPALTCVCN